MYPEIKEIDETMSRYLILPKEWDFIGRELPIIVIAVIVIIIILVTGYWYMRRGSTNTLVFAFVVKCMGKS